MEVQTGPDPQVCPRCHSHVQTISSPFCQQTRPCHTSQNPGSAPPKLIQIPMNHPTLRVTRVTELSVLCLAEPAPSAPLPRCGRSWWTGCPRSSAVRWMGGTQRTLRSQDERSARPCLGRNRPTGSCLRTGLVQ